MERDLGRYDRSVFYRIRAGFSVLLLECLIIFLPPLCFLFYISLFLYPSYLTIALGYPIINSYSCFCFLIILIYTIHWISDIGTPCRGGRRSSYWRSLPLWKWASQYFPARLVVTEELREWSKENGQDICEEGEAVFLPTSSNYLLGYHPHGLFANGALLAYGSESLNFSKIFPGIKSHVCTLNVFFNTPFYRDITMNWGAVSVNQESLVYLLDKAKTGISGNLVAVVVGGVREILESRPGHYVLMLSRRRGFFRIALRTGAYLIPSIGFGETNMYDLATNREGTKLRKIQDWFLKVINLPPLSFYSSRVLPYRQPLTVVVGSPIMRERIPNPTDEEVDELREEYKKRLVQLFNKYRPLYDPTAEDIQFI